MKLFVMILWFATSTTMPTSERIEGFTSRAACERSGSAAAGALQQHPNIWRAGFVCVEVPTLLE